MIYLVDTNVLLRFVYRPDPMHPLVRTAARTLRRGGDQLRATPQNFVEFWNVATRPTSANGIGLGLREANRLLRRGERAFPLLPDSPAIYPEWRRLVVTFGVSGVKVHDARLVAVMLAHRVTHILTFNTSDFARYSPEGITAVDPATV